MKKIMITVSEGSISRNILRSFLLDLLLKDEQVFLYLLVPADKADFYAREFGRERIKVLPISPLPQGFFGRLMIFLSGSGLKTETVFTDQERRYRRGGGFLSFAAKRVFAFLFGSSRIMHLLIRRLAGQRRPDAVVTRIFREVRPDVLFATDILEDADLHAIAAGRAVGCAVVGMARSWDNLGSRLVVAVPDALAVWNQYLARMAAAVQHLPENIIKIVGIPHYDWYVKKDILAPRRDFLAEFGAAPEKKIILFCGIGTEYAPREAEVAEILSRAIEAGDIDGNTAIIFRPHPGLSADAERISSLPHVFFDHTVATREQAGLRGEQAHLRPSGFGGQARDMSWEKESGAIARLVNSLYHADVVVSIASSITIDAVAFGKPVVCIGFDGYHQEEPAFSLAEVYRNHTHYKDLSRTGGFKIAYSAGDLIRYINQYRADPGMDAEGRKKIFSEFIGFLDGKSSERLSEVILAHL
ncbi:MAG: hypothetical protein AAB915_01510 [Patescibacteria group bacterium]